LGVTADIVTLAKSIASGIPMGACLATGDAACTLVPGDHGSTFGGQPVACAAALATLSVLRKEKLAANAASTGAFFMQLLLDIQKRLPGKIKEVRGMGLMVGVDLVEPVARTMVERLLSKGVVANAVGTGTLRFLPPLVVTPEDCKTAARILERLLAEQK
ncbi:MAG TPA: aminotransferase class III-fold pyridoxal phosphate-dependent enzyme, partial [Chthonomonadales bacterium]|nr:aminotransferase class III-fold pyridoxal phosphate-dependent enzyme [Chthonomonadales bacterium]